MLNNTCAIFAADGGDGGRCCGEPGHLGRGQLQQQQGRGHRGLGLVTLVLTTGVTLGEVTLLLTGEVPFLLGGKIAFLLGGKISFLLGGEVSFLCGWFVCCCGCCSCCRSYCCCCSFLGPLRWRVLKAGRKWLLRSSVINLRAAAISCCIVTGRRIAARSSIFVIAVTPAGDRVVQVLHPVLVLVVVSLGPGLREICAVHLAQDVVKHGSGQRWWW